MDGPPSAHLVGDARMESLRQRYGSADYRAATGAMRGVLVKAVAEDGAMATCWPRSPARSSWSGATADTAAPLAMAEAALERCRDGTG